jgi:hypothetical protein
LGLFETVVEVGGINPNAGRGVEDAWWWEKAPFVEAVFVHHMVRNGALDKGPIGEREPNVVF